MASDARGRLVGRALLGLILRYACSCYTSANYITKLLVNSINTSAPARHPARYREELSEPLKSARGHREMFESMPPNKHFVTSLVSE